MKIELNAKNSIILIDDNGKSFARVPSDWLLGRDIKNAPMYFYVSPNGSNGGGVVIEWSKVTHLIKGGVETAFTGSADDLFNTLVSDFFKSVSGSGTTNATAEKFEEVNGTFQIKQSWLTSFVQSVTGGGGTPVVTPNPPSNGIVDNTARTFAYTLSSGYALSEHEYQIGGGAITAALNPIPVGTGALAIGAVKVRVKAGTNRNASSWLTNTSAFTSASGGGSGLTDMNQDVIDTSSTIIRNGNNFESTYAADVKVFNLKAVAGSDTIVRAKISTNFIGFGFGPTTNPVSASQGFVALLSDNNRPTAIFNNAFTTGTTQAGEITFELRTLMVSSVWTAQVWYSTNDGTSFTKLNETAAGSQDLYLKLYWNVVGSVLGIKYSGLV